jgi:predicted transcriptional regulator
MLSLKPRYQLIFKLLFTIKIGRNKPIMIMNEINTSQKVTLELLSGMIEGGLIECIREKKRGRISRKQYYITTKGNQLYDSLMLSQGVVEYNQQKKLGGINFGLCARASTSTTDNQPYPN